MCGLAGCVRFGGGPASDLRPLLTGMARHLQRRGPDGVTYRQDGPAGLGFTRLSIVDPEGGDQPLLSADGDVALIANGEVYNHRELRATLPAGTRLRTDSDCEVLVPLYQRDGVRFLDSVRGIFAVVIWDRRRGRLVLARDRFGIKPLYFHRNAERIVVASEIKALLADPDTPRRLDWRQCLGDQMTTAAPAVEHDPPVTWFEGVESVPAGAVLEVDARTGEITEHRYWRLPSFRDGADASPAELVAAYGAALRASVAESCMSDAEIGLFLSGGVDSAAVAAFATVPQLQTFTALNGGTLANGDGEYAHRVARALDLPNHQLAFPVGRVPGRQEWKDLLWLVESPLCGPEQFYKYELHRYARSTRPDLKVMLLGQASDEFNGGYSVGLARGGDWAEFTDGLRQLARRRALYREPHLAPWEESAHRLLSDEALGARSPGLLEDPYQAFVTWKYRDIQQYNNWHEDRTAAGNGIEARVPFLDHRVVEAAAAVPVGLRSRLLWDKEILRAALAGVLPVELVRRPKVPFYYGPGQRQVHRTFLAMLAQDGGALVEEALSGPLASRVLDADGVRATLRRLHDDPGSGQLELLLRVLNVGLLEQLLADPPAAPGRNAPAVLPELVVHDWEAQRAEIDARVLHRGPLDLAAVPVLGEDVLLVAAEPADGTYYLAVGGSLEYVVDAAGDPAWLALLRGMDGERSLGVLLAAAGVAVDAVEEPLREAVDVGVVQLVRAPVPETLPRPVGAGGGVAGRPA